MQPLLKSELSVIDATGDSKFTWDVDSEEEIAVARDMFNSLKKKKYIAYTVGQKGKKDEVIHRFDETLGMIIMIPPVVGG